MISVLGEVGRERGSATLQAKRVALLPWHPLTLYLTTFLLFYSFISKVPQVGEFHFFITFFNLLLMGHPQPRLHFLFLV